MSESNAHMAGLYASVAPDVYIEASTVESAIVERLVVKWVIPDDLSGSEELFGRSEKLALRSKDGTAVGVILCFTAGDCLEAVLAESCPCSVADGLTMRMRAPGGNFLALPWQEEGPYFPQTLFRLLTLFAQRSSPVTLGGEVCSLKRVLWLLWGEMRQAFPMKCDWTGEAADRRRAGCLAMKSI